MPSRVICAARVTPATVSASRIGVLGFTKLAPGRVWNVAAMLRSGLKSCAQAARPRSVRTESESAKDLSARRPSSLRLSVTLLALVASAKVLAPTIACSA